MPIPDFQTLMLPVLRLVADGSEHTIRESEAELSVKFDLSEAERAEQLSSSRQKIFYNRVSWAKVYLQMAGLIVSPRRGRLQITERGKKALAKKPERIDIKFLEAYPEFLEFRSRKKSAEKSTECNTEPTDGETPEETLEEAYHKIRQRLATELLLQVKSATPRFFEDLVVELLVKMGYGGSRDEAGQAIGGVGDEGIDGIINEDRLGLDVIYIQAKKWEGTVGRPEIQKFVGALHGKRAHKGVFITTGRFASEAARYVSNIESRVVLIDGNQLAELMIDFGLGVASTAVYEIKRVDTDYFGEA